MCPESFCFRFVDGKLQLICSMGNITHVVQTWSCGTVRVLCVLDISGSIAAANAQANVRAAAMSFANGLQQSGAQGLISMLTFSGFNMGADSDATFITNVAGNKYRDVTSQGDFATLQTEITTGLADANFGGFTDWEAAFKLAQSLSPGPDVIVFVTDGNPTVALGVAADGTNNGPNEDFYVYRAAVRAQALQVAGARVISVLIGNDIDVANVRTAIQSDNQGLAFSNNTNAIITSNSTGAVGGPVLNTDYYVTDYSGIEQTLSGLVV